MKEFLKVVRSTRYPLDAFLFIQRGLDFTVRRIHGEQAESGDEQGAPSRHVTGHQLCMGLRDYAIKQYGLMAKPVLNRWNIHCCEDFGQMVFALVNAGLMHKTEDDSVEDFVGVFDFDEAFLPALQLSENI